MSAREDHEAWEERVRATIEERRQFRERRRREERTRQRGYTAGWFGALAVIYFILALAASSPVFLVFFLVAGAIGCVFGWLYLEGR